MTGTELRLVPAEPIKTDRDLFEVVPGEPDRKVELDAVVKIRNGKRFFTAPAHINPDACRPCCPRRMPRSLSERWVEHSVSAEGGMVCVVVPRWTLPPGYNVPEADLLVRLPMGYPDLPPDMWWFSPLCFAPTEGRSPPHKLQSTISGRVGSAGPAIWVPNNGIPGVDGIGSFFALIRQELVRCASPEQRDSYPRRPRSHHGYRQAHAPRNVETGAVLGARIVQTEGGDLRLLAIGIWEVPQMLMSCGRSDN